MDRPTRQQIDDEIQNLELAKRNVQQFTFFGDDNYRAIDSQIEALREFLSEDEIYEICEDDYTIDSALYAVYWRLGLEDLPPSENWRSLAL